MLKDYPKFELVAIPRALIQRAEVTLPLNGKSRTIPMQSMIESLRGAWLEYLAAESK